MLKVALTHDVDRTSKSHQYFSHLFRSIKKKDFKDAQYHATSWRKRNEVYWNFEDIIEIETSYGIKSTFYFLIESYPFRLNKPATWKLSIGRYNIHEPRIVSVMKYLDKNGWEVGLHGSYESYRNFSLLSQEKQTLEKILGHSIIGIRQHYLNLNENTWSLQEKAGFKYDTSWGLNNQIGFKNNIIKPFSPFNNSFIVFPLSVMDFCYMQTPNRQKVFTKIIEQVMANDAILVINWHNNNFGIIDFPGYRDAYIEIIESCKIFNAKFDTLSNFYLLSTI